MPLVRLYPPNWATRNTDQLIHHSDQVIQYTCKYYIKILKEHGIRISMSAKGNPYGNAFAESLIKTLKQEEVVLWQYETFSNVAERIPYFILDVCNRKRLHSALGYRPPEEFESLLAEKGSTEYEKAKTLFVYSEGCTPNNLGSLWLMATLEAMAPGFLLRFY